MTDAKPATDQTKTDKAKAVRPPLKFIDKFFMAFMGLFFIAGIVVFSTLFVPDFMRRGMQEDLAEGGGTLAPAQIVAVAETGRWYAKRPILHISAQVAPAGAAGFATQFDQEVGLLQLGQFRTGAQIWVRYNPAKLSEAVIVNAPVTNAPAP